MEKKKCFVTVFYRVLLFGHEKYDIRALYANIDEENGNSFKYSLIETVEKIVYMYNV